MRSALLLLADFPPDELAKINQVLAERDVLFQRFMFDEQ
jgi:hypothetical protein